MRKYKRLVGAYAPLFESSVREWIDNRQLAIDHLAMLRVFGVKSLAAGPYCGGDDDRVIKRELAAFLNLDSPSSTSTRSPLAASVDSRYSRTLVSFASPPRVGKRRRGWASLGRIDLDRAGRGLCAPVKRDMGYLERWQSGLMRES